MRQVQFEGHTLTIWEREDWQDPRLPVHSTNAFEWDTDTEAIHYTAAVDLPDGDKDELPPPGSGLPEWWLLPPYLRAIQRDYQLNRGYAIGYNWPIDYLGGIWEARGWDFECAANVGWNPRTYALLLLVDGNDKPNEHMLRSCRYLHSEAERLSKRPQMIRPHSQLLWRNEQQILMPWPGSVSGCPGTGAREEMIVPSGLQGGKFNWRYYTPTPVPPTPGAPTTPGEEEDPMVLITNKEVFFAAPPKQMKFLLLASGKLRHITSTAEYYARKAAPHAEVEWTNAEIGTAGVI